MNPKKVWTFWFKHRSIKDWFGSGAKKFDRIIRKRFSDVLLDAEHKRLGHWLVQRKGYISLILVLDQFSRHIYRGTSDAYKNDHHALQIANSIPKDILLSMQPREQMFALLPFQHSESLIVQKKGLRIIKHLLSLNPSSRYLQLSLKHHRGHCKVIQQFGRFPKRLPPSQWTAKERSYIENSQNLPY